MSLITPESGLIIWTIIIFGLVFFVLAKFAFPLITGMIQKRTDAINDSIKSAQEAEHRLKNLASEQEKLIHETKKQQDLIIKESLEARNKMMAKAREQAQEEAASILEQAKVEIASQKEEALKDIRRQVAILSIEVAEKILKTKLSTDDAQLKLADRLVEEASKTEIRN